MPRGFPALVGSQQIAGLGRQGSDLVFLDQFHEPRDVGLEQLVEIALQPVLIGDETAVRTQPATDGAAVGRQLGHAVAQTDLPAPFEVTH